jgi:mono/diheme cytochrome c family protein
MRGFSAGGALEVFPIPISPWRIPAGLTDGRAVMYAGLAAVMGFGLAGCHAKASLTPQQAEGKRLFDVGCAHCHVENNLHLKKVPPDLHDLFARKMLPDGTTPATDTAVEQVLTTGKGLMPSFAYQMNKQQMAAVVAYLHVYAAAPSK